MQADQGALTVIVVGVVALVAAFGGLGLLTTAGGKKEGGGTSPGRIATIGVLLLFALMLLGSPGTGHFIAGSINMMWGNILTGIQPLFVIAFQIVLFLAAIYVIWILVRNRIRR